MPLSFIYSVGRCPRCSQDYGVVEHPSLPAVMQVFDLPQSNAAGILHIAGSSFAAALCPKCGEILALRMALAASTESGRLLNLLGHKENSHG